MSNKSCDLEPLAMSKYCRLLICPDCGVIHFNLPYRVSLQFEVKQFLAIAEAFSEAARKLRHPDEVENNPGRNVIELKKIH